MRLLKTSAQLLVALPMSLCLALGALAQATAPNSPKQAAKPKAAKAAKTATTAKAPKSSPAAKPKPAASAKAAPAAPPTAEASAPEGAAPSGDNPEVVNKRDPFAPLVNEKKDAGAMHLPPGKAGLVIATVRVDGTVRAQAGMIAIVSNPNNSVYFVREGDRLYDGDVEKIGLDGVTFQENSKDAFGHPIERMVTKRIYASAGEQQ